MENSYFFNYFRIFHLGDVIELNPKSNVNNIMDDINPFNDKWFKYNPRRPIPRDGLSIINDTGKLVPGPDLDSLPQYNAENKTKLSELDFKTPTPVFHTPEIKKLLSPMQSFIARTHILKLPQGGYFPPHRDEALREERDRVLSFRLIMALKNTNYPNVQFMLDNKFVEFRPGTLYVVNTFKSHSLINMSTNDSYWLVINGIICDDAVDYVHMNMSVR